MIGRILLAIALLVLLVPATVAQGPCALEDASPEQVHAGLEVDAVTRQAIGLWIQWAHACAPVVAPPHVEWSLNGVAQPDAEGLVAGQPFMQDSRFITSGGEVSPVIFAAGLGATAGDEIQYRVVNGDNATQWFDIQMPASESVRVVAFGDQGTRGVQDNGERNPGAASAPSDVRDEALRHNSSLFLALGDLAYADDSAPFGPGWDRYFRMNQPLMATTATMAVAGNHERESIYDPFAFDQFMQRFVLPDDEHHYGFRAGPIYFVAMNSELFCVDVPGAPEGECEDLGKAANPDVTLRLRQELAKAQASGAPWIVVMHHHNVYSVADHNRYTAIRNHWAPLYEQAGVDLVVSGHTHNYLRTYPLVNSIPQDTDASYVEGAGVVYVGAGGGGRTLRPIDPVLLAAAPWAALATSQYSLAVINATEDRLEVEGFNTSGGSLDVFEIVKVPAGSGSLAPRVSLPHLFPPVLALVGWSRVRGRKAP